MKKPKPGKERRSLTQVLFWVLLFVAAVSVYINTLFSDFVWDDFFLILEDHTVKSWEYFKVIFTSDFFGHQENDLAYGYFRPIISLSYAIDYSVWQKSPFGYHLTNTLFHGIATLLVAAALSGMGIARLPAFAAALLFAIHPIHTENVAWISGRTDVVAFVFAMTAFVVHLWNLRKKSHPTITTSLALLSFAIALMSKEMAIVVVPWIAVVEYVIFNKDWKTITRSLVPYICVFLLYAVWRFWIVNVPVPVSSADVSIWDRILSAPWTTIRYISWLFLPLKQTAYVQNPFIFGLGDYRIYVGLAGLGGIGYLLYRSWKTAPMFFVILMMFVVSFGPILNFIPISGPADMGNVMAERFLYFPSFPFLALITLAVHTWGFKPNTRDAVLAAFILVSLCLSVATFYRNRDWKNNEVFYRATLDVSDSALIWSNLAVHYMYLSKWKKAKHALDQAQKFYAGEYAYLSAMAQWHVAQKQYDEAIMLQWKVASMTKRGRAVAYNNLAFLYRSLGDFERATDLLHEIIDNKSGYADVFFNLAEVHRATGNPDKAIKYYKKALERRPDNISMATALATTLMQENKLKEAASVFEQQLRMHRDSPGLLSNLGLVRKKMKRLDEAVVLFKQALERDPKYLKARLNLAGAYLSMGKKQQAVSQLNQVVKINRTSSEGKTAANMLKKLSAKK